MIRVGIVGCGNVARSHLQALERVPGVEVVGACDAVAERLERTRSQFRIEGAYGDAADMLGRERLDVVHVLTPPATHKSLSIQALEAGCHVLVEKPMALDVGEADELLEASRRSGRTLGVCHNYLFSPALLSARDLASSGRLGRVVAVEIFWRVWRGKKDRYATTPWLRQLPGGLFHESAPHVVYLQQEFLGPLRVVAAVVADTHPSSSPSGELRAVFEGASGIGTVHISFSASPYQFGLRIYGTKMTAYVDIANHILVKAPGDGAGHGSALRTSPHTAAQLLLGAARARLAVVGRPRHRAHANFIARFYESLHAGAPPPVSGEDGRSVVALLDDLWRAIPDASRGRATEAVRDTR